MRKAGIFLTLILICSQAYCQDDFLRVNGNIKTDTLIFSKDPSDISADPDTGFPSGAEGEVFYNFKSGAKQPYYHDDTGWKPFSGEGPKNAASIIVAARNSSGTTCAGGVCASLKADIVCGGATPDKADNLYIQDAIDALGSNGGAVYLLEGTYDIAGTITLDNVGTIDSNKSIIGSGSATVLRHAGASYIITVNSANGVLISQLTIDGNNASNLRGINLQCSSDARIEKVFLKDMLTSRGIYVRCCSNINITNNSSESVERGVQFYDTINSIVSGNSFIGSNEGVFIGGVGVPVDCAGECSGVPAVSGILDSVYNIISNNIFRGGGLTTSQYSSSNIISDNDIMFDPSNCVFIVNSSNKDNVITGNRISSCDGTGIELNGSDENLISGNLIESAGDNGLRLYASKYNLISGNFINESGRLSSSNDGIKIEGSASIHCPYNLISGNRIIDSAGSSSSYGIDISADIEDTYLSANLITQAGGGPINDLGTRTKYTDKIKMSLEKKDISVTDPYTLDTINNPGYLRLSLTGGVTGTVTLGIVNSTSTGQILIIENGGAAGTTIVISPTNASLNAVRAPFTSLLKNDTIGFIWDGTKWVEFMFYGGH